jgi:hypothetical protein
MHLGNDTCHWILRFRDRLTKEVVWEWTYQESPVLIGHLQNADPEFKDTVRLVPGQYQVWVSLRGDRPALNPDGTFAHHHELASYAFVEVE